MAIAFRSVSSLPYASRGQNNVAVPAGAAIGDVMVATMITTSAGGTAPTPANTVGGFVQFGTATTVTDNSAFNGKLFIFWKRCTAADTGNYTWFNGTTNTQLVVKCYSGCISTGTPLAATSNNSGGEEIATGTGITTTAANSYLLFEAHDWTGNGALSPPSGMTERFDSLIYSADQLIATAGATGNRVQTNGNPAGVTNNKWAVRMIELLAEGTGPSPSTGTLTATLGDATGSLTGTVRVGGTAAGTALPATLVGTGVVTTGAVELHENVRETEGGDWREIEDGTIRIVDSISLGTLSTTLDNATLAATGKVYVGGTLAVTLGAATATMTGKVAVGAMLAVTLAAATPTMTGKVTVGGTAAGTALPATLVATGTVANQVYSGSLTATLAAATLSATGTVVTVVAPTADNVRETEAGDWRETEDGTVRIVDSMAVGLLAVTLGDATGTLTGKVTVGGTAAGTAAPAILVGTGTVTLGPPPPDLDGVRETEDNNWRETEDGTIRLIDRISVGILASTLGDVTGTLTGKVTVGGTAAGTAAPASLVATGTVTGGPPPPADGSRETEDGNWRETEDGIIRIVDSISVATLSVTLAPATLSASGTVSTGPLPADGSRETEAGDFRETEDGIIRIVEGAPSAGTVTGTLNVTLANATLQATGTSGGSVAASYIKMWNGTEWLDVPVKVWAGSSWVTRKVKVWNGTAWVDA